MRQEGLDDMTLIARVDIPNILDNLQKRFMKDIIYVSGCKRWRRATALVLVAPPERFPGGAR